MKIVAVQLQPKAGDIAENIQRHVFMLKAAIKEKAQLVLFPELSVTGYEPRMASSLAMPYSTDLLDVFQQFSDANQIIIGVGAPLQSDAGVQIAMFWFLPGKPREVYAKQWLHADEEVVFVPGTRSHILHANGFRFATAICYESVQLQHASNAVNAGANVYLASVAKSSSGMDHALQHYAGVAQQYGIPVLVSNSVGACDDFISAGQSAAFHPEGGIPVHLGRKDQGLVIWDLMHRTGHTHIPGKG